MRVNAYSHLSIFEMCSSYTRCHFPSGLERRRRNGNHGIESPATRASACARPSRQPLASAAAPGSALRVKSSACAASPVCVQLPEISRPFFFSWPSYTPPTRGTSNRTRVAVQRHIAQRQNSVLVHAVHRPTQLAAAGFRDRHHQMQLARQAPRPTRLQSRSRIPQSARTIRQRDTKNQARQQLTK